MSRATIGLFVALASLSCAAPRARAPAPNPSPAPAPLAETFREQAPLPLELEGGFVAPLPEERRLSSGLRVWVNERHGLPLVSVLLVVMRGVDAEPAGKAGLASLTARMLTEGTRTRSSTRIAEETQDLALHLWAGAGAESSLVGMNSLTETLGSALDLFADVALNPAFRAPDFARVVKLELTELEQKKGLARALASDAMAMRLYGPRHPWGQPSGGTPDTLKRLATRDLADFHRRVFIPNDALLVVVGDITADEAVRQLEMRFGKWKRGAPLTPRLPPVPALEKRSVTFIAHPGSQSQLWMGGRLFSARNPDAIPARLANLVMGGMFSSRLNQALREDKGYAYGYFSSLQLQRDTGTWTASGGIEAQHTASAVKEALAQLTRFSAEGPTDEELLRAKERYIGSLPPLFETNDATAGALATLFIHAQPPDYFRTLPTRIRKVTREEVQAIARSYVHPERWPIVVVGPGATEEPLRALDLGPLETRTP